MNVVLNHNFSALFVLNAADISTTSPLIWRLISGAIGQPWWCLIYNSQGREAGKMMRGPSQNNSALLFYQSYYLCFIFQTWSITYLGDQFITDQEKTITYTTIPILDQADIHVLDVGERTNGNRLYCGTLNTNVASNLSLFVQSVGHLFIIATFFRGIWIYIADPSDAKWIFWRLYYKASTVYKSLSTNICHVAKLK